MKKLIIMLYCFLIAGFSICNISLAQKVTVKDQCLNCGRGLNILGYDKRSSGRNRTKGRFKRVILK